MKTPFRLAQLPALLLLLFTLSNCTAPHNFHTAALPINGTCAQCEELIEQAAYKKKEAEVNWDPATRQAYIIYNPQKTSLTEVYKRLAYAGFDTPEFRAPDEVYATLPACCKYKRQQQGTLSGNEDHAQHTAAETNQATDHTGHDTHAGHKATEKKPELTPANPPKNAHVHAAHEAASPKHAEPIKPAEPVIKADPHAGHNKAATSANSTEKPAAKPTNTTKPSATPKQTEPSPLHEVYTHYFALKDALVRDDSKTATAKATVLEKAIAAVPMNKLSGAAHDIWMKHYKNLQIQAGQVAKAKNLAAQRSAFAALTPHLEPVIKAVIPRQPVYLQHCPMFNNNKGANWLSQEKTIKNPFYGKAMLSCGSTKETIR